MVRNWLLRLTVCFSISIGVPVVAASPDAITSLAGYSGILNETVASADGQSGDGQTSNQSSGIYPSPNAPKTPPAIYKPYTVAQKFKFATTDSFGPVALVAVGVSAGFSQLTNTPSAWGQGAEGYGKRYGSAFGLNLSDEYFEAVLNSTLRQDPRYFPSKDRSAKGRFKHAVGYLFIARKDDGGTSFAYGRWGGALGAGFLANTWNPRSDSHVSDAFERAGFLLAADAGFHLAEEFIPFFRHLAP